jgi:glycosyltransferase involved in cell wall biosynthesis
MSAGRRGLRPKVCFVGGAILSPGLDDSAKKKYQTLSGLAEITVICSSPNIRLHVFSDHASFVCVPRLPIPIVRRLVGLLLQTGVILWITITRGIDILVFQSPPEAVVGTAVRTIARRLSGRDTKIIIENHGDFLGDPLLQRKLPLEKAVSLALERTAHFALTRADALRAVSSSTEHQLRGYNSTVPSRRFPAWTDIDCFLEAGNAHPPRDRNSLLFVGAIIPRKGLLHLVDALRLIRQEHPHAHLRIIGPSPNEGFLDQVRSSIAGHGLGECIYFLDPIGQKELALRMATSHLLILPSLSEGLGRVVFEAMAAGLPVVGSEVGGIGDLIEDGVTGYLVEPGATQALAKATSKLLAEPELANQFGVNGRRFARSFFSTEIYAAQYKRLFEDAVTAK